MTGLASIEDALAALRSGRPVLVTDSEDRENEGDVILAAQTLTDEWMAWTIRHTSGYVCVPLTAATADRFDLPPMVEDNRDPLRTAYTVTVDAAVGVTTGISAADRAATIRLLADPHSGPASFTRPGHVVPLRARAGGVLERPGHTEAGVDLCRLAGLNPVAAIAELVNDDGTMMRLPEVLATGALHDLPVVTIAQLIAWRQRHDRVERLAETRLPTAHGEFAAIGYRDRLTGHEHVALISPQGLRAPKAVTRLHSECLTGDALGSLRCDCGPQLKRSLERIAQEGGVLVYLRGHEGRGIGLAAKLQAYALQDNGFDTVDAQLELNLPVDPREYAAGAAILTDLGLQQLRLLTNNPAKVAALTAYGLEVVGVERLSIVPNPANRDYLRTKRDRMGHDLIIDASESGESA
jgi:3,4-dihydroxy 2-butanone 4-phosphate synthase / GTP cyclohydrolase II